MGDWRYFHPSTQSSSASWAQYNQMTGGWRDYENSSHQNTMNRDPAPYNRQYFQSQAMHQHQFRPPVHNNAYDNAWRRPQPYSYWAPQPTPTPPPPSVSPEMFDHLDLPGSRSGRQIVEMQKTKKLMRKLQEENARNDLEKIQLTADVSSTSIHLRWKPPSNLKEVTYRVKITDQKDPDVTKIQCDRTFVQPHYEFKTVAGATYCVEINCRTIPDGVFVARVYKEIRAEFNNAEMRLLYDKCLNFLTDNGTHEPFKHEFFYLYRCKPKLYWDEIHLCCNDLMQTYVKDENGQPANLINGKINGLFFSARLGPDLQLPQSSPFGNVRMVVNANLLLNPQSHNYYFADFYCNALPHYVTIVICIKNSETDRFCKPRLLSLNPISNPFIHAVPPSATCHNWRFFVNRSVWVEVYFTEDIPLNMAKFDAIFTTGAGTSRLNGLPNNKACTRCNLYPPGDKQRQDTETKDELELSSTLRIIKSSDAHIDVSTIVCQLIDDTCDNTRTTDEIMSKSDEELREAVARMNQEIHDKKHELNTATDMIADLVSEFQKERDEILSHLKHLKEF